uniref:Uncharacterized protein n=1 Tax=Arundo donax TaxID=35708 RepID=A0A0A9FZ20_ARUDO
MYEQQYHPNPNNKKITHNANIALLTQNCCMPLLCPFIEKHDESPKSYRKFKNSTFYFKNSTINV